jgi:hypothetical protein
MGCLHIDTLNNIYSLLADGVGVHRTRSISVSLPSPPELRSVSVLLEGVPIAVLSSNRLAAGVRLPTASDRRGVHEGGPMFPLSFRSKVPVLRDLGVNISAFTRRLFAALLESLCAIASLDVISGMRKAALASTGSPV